MAKSKQKPKAGSKSAKTVARSKTATKSKAKPVQKAVKGKPKAVAKAKPVAAKAGKIAAKKPVSVARKPAAAAVRKTPAKATKATRPVKPAAPARKVPAKPKAVVKPPSKQTSKISKPVPPSPKNRSSSVIETTAAPPKSPKAAPKPKQGTLATTNELGVTMQDGRYALSTTTTIDLPKGYRPSAKEEYMNPFHLEYFRRKLQDWRGDLVEESKQTIENLRDEVRDVGDEAERATRETENSLELRTRDRYRKLISKIDKALKRIEEGRYGFCEETDEDIGLDRLDARPIATLCLDAQERWEHRQKQMGD